MYSFDFDFDFFFCFLKQFSGAFEFILCFEDLLVLFLLGNNKNMLLFIFLSMHIAICTHAKFFVFMYCLGF